MARKIARKSNKTSHVLNLLTDPKSSEPSTEYQNEIPAPTDPIPIEDIDSSQPPESPDPMPNPAPAASPDAVPNIVPAAALAKPQEDSSQNSVPPSPVQPSVDISQAWEDRISKQIHDSLSMQLAEEEAKEAERAEQHRRIAARIAAEINAKQQASPSMEEDTSQEDITLAENPSSDEQVEPPKASIPEKERTPEYDFELINVIECILDQFQTDFMEKFGMCTCRHCWMDTRALTLSSLSAKYVVLKQDSIEPMLNFYDHRYRGMIMAQLTQACMTVMADPHH